MSASTWLHVVKLAALGALTSCALPSEDYGKPCPHGDGDCAHGFVCFDGGCVPPDYPLLDAAEGEGDGGEGDAAEGEGDGEGEGDAGEGEGDAGEGEGDAGEGEGEGEGDLVAGDTCSSALTLAFDVDTAGDTTGARDDNADSTNCGGAGEFPAPDVVYEVDMPAGHALHVVVSSDAPTYFMFVKVFGDCAQTALACQDSVTADIDLVVPSAPAGPLFIMVDGFTGDDFGPFTIRASAE